MPTTRRRSNTMSCVRIVLSDLIYPVQSKMGKGDIQCKYQLFADLAARVEVKINRFVLEYAGPVSNPAFSCILRFLMQFHRAPDNSKLFPGPSLYQAYSKPIPSYFQPIPSYSSLFQPMPSLFQAYSKLIPSYFQAYSELFHLYSKLFQMYSKLFQLYCKLVLAFP